MGRRAASNIIDVIPSDDASAPTVFGPGATSTASYRPESGWRGSAAIGLEGARPAPTVDASAREPQPRRANRSTIVVAGLVAVVAVIGAVALVTGGADDHPGAAPRVPATTVAAAPVTTVVDVAGSAAAAATVVVGVNGGSILLQDTGAQVAAPPPALAPLFLPQLPPQYQVMTAEQVYPYGTVVSPPLVRQLWVANPTTASTPTAGTSTGTTAATRRMRIAAGDTALGAVDGGVRVATANGVAVVAGNASGELTAIGPIAGGSATVTAVGLTIDQLVAVVNGAALAGTSLTFAAGSLPADLQLAAFDTPADPATRPPATSIAEMSVSYQSSQAPNATLWIEGTDGLSPVDAVWETLGAPANDRLDLGGGRTADVRSRTGADGEWSSIDVTVDGVALRITGTAPLADALVAARTLVHVGPERWTSLRAVAALNQQAYPPVHHTDLVQLDGGADGLDARWSVLSARGASGAPDAYQVRLRGTSTEFAQDGAPAVHVVSDQTVTVVVGVAPPGHDGAFLHVVLGGASYTVPLRPQADGGTNLFGVFAFANVIAPVTEVVDLGGEVLATGPSLAPG